MIGTVDSSDRLVSVAAREFCAAKRRFGVGSRIARRFPIPNARIATGLGSDPRGVTARTVARVTPQNIEIR